MATSETKTFRLISKQTAEVGITDKVGRMGAIRLRPVVPAGTPSGSITPGGPVPIGGGEVGDRDIYCGGLSGEFVDGLIEGDTISIIIQKAGA